MYDRVRIFGNHLDISHEFWYIIAQYLCEMFLHYFVVTGHVDIKWLNDFRLTVDVFHSTNTARGCRVGIGRDRCVGHIDILPTGMNEPQYFFFQSSDQEISFTGIDPGGYFFLVQGIAGVVNSQNEG